MTFLTTLSYSTISIYNYYSNNTLPECLINLLDTLPIVLIIYALPITKIIIALFL